MKSFYTLFFTLVAAVVFAQTPYSIHQNTNKSYGGDNAGMGSSFKTIGSAYLDSIDVIIRTGYNTSSTVKLFQGNTNDAAALLLEETATGIPTGMEALYRIRFQNSVLLDASSTYTFMMYNNPLRFGYINSYADGALWTGQGFLSAGEHTDADLDFIAYFGGPVVTSTENAYEEEAPIVYANRTLTVRNGAADDISVSDVKGVEVSHGKGDVLSLENLPEGIYLIAVRKEQQVYKAKIFVEGR